MTRVLRTTWIVAVCFFVLAMASPSFALYIPNKLFGAMYTDYGDMPTTTVNHPFFENITPFPAQYVLDETNINGAFPPAGTEGGMFERNEHVIRFATNGETANGQGTGHKFQRREAWDFAWDMKIETPNISPRKEAGIYFKSAAGNALFIATSNGPGHYDNDPGTIGTVFAGVIPEYSFSGGGGPLGDYNGNKVVDAADYTVWRDTLGSTTDFRANGSNEGASLDLIDQADYDVWKEAFGDSSSAGPNYNVGDTVRMRLVYTPPILANDALPDVDNDPNVTTPGTLEYIISINGGSPVTSGALPFTNSWKGIPKDTLVMWRVQNNGTAAVDNDSSKVTFNNFDFNGDLPGSGLSGAGGIAGGVVPEPASMLLVGMAFGWIGMVRRRTK
jgi:hypothetical protein